MNIEFKSISWKNILSYGNTPVTMPVSPGLISLLGKNGQGKSVFLDALSFCLFGKPYRNIKIKELLNRKNKKELIVETTFIVDNQIEYKLTRGLSPDVLTMEYHNVGSDNFQKIDLLSSKKLNQVEIDKILGVNYNLFKQIISLSINHNEPFLTLDAKDKRDVTEQICNVRVFGDMLKVVKKDISDLKVSIQMNDKSINILKSYVDALKMNADKLTNLKTNFENKKIEEIHDLEDDKKIANKELKKLKDVKSKLLTEKKSLTSISTKDIQSLNSNIKELNKEEAIYENELNNAKKIIKHLDVHDICPLCKSTLDEEHKISERQSQEDIIKDCQVKLVECVAKIEQYEEELGIANKILSRTSTIDNDVKILKTKIDMYITEIERIDSDIEAVQSRIFEESESDKDDGYDIKKKELDCLLEEQEKISSRLEDSLILSEILSDDGIRSYIVKKIVPVLNKIVNEYIQYFDMPIVLQFNELMEETITLPGGHKNVSYHSFSEGEKKRIDMSILLSFIKITKVLSNWNCNLLIIDELLDSSVDDDGLGKLLKSFAIISKESNNQSIFIISHRLQQEFTHMFNKVVHIKKSPNGFSSLEMER